MKRDGNVKGSRERIRKICWFSDEKKEFEGMKSPWLIEWFFELIYYLSWILVDYPKSLKKLKKISYQLH